jgi:redox-sensing transcriptional repressor
MMSGQENNLINRLTLDRLMQYYHWVTENLDPASESKISSSQLAKQFALDDSQVRKDLAAIGVKGQRNVGFDLGEVIGSIQQVLGLNQAHPAVVLGAGRLGGAISSYKGFVNYGLNIVALFDNDPAKIGLMIGGHVVQPLDHLESIIKQSHIRLGVLAVPDHAAQESADRLVKTGIRVIWNFSPAHLHLPDDIFVRHERLFVALAQLFYHLNRSQK